MTREPKRKLDGDEHRAGHGTTGAWTKLPEGEPIGTFGQKGNKGVNVVAGRQQNAVHTVDNLSEIRSGDETPAKSGGQLFLVLFVAGLALMALFWFLAL